MNILEALKKYIRTNGGSSRANNISEAVKDLDSIPQGSGSGAMFVNITIDENDAVTADKTYNEINNALLSGTPILAKCECDDTSSQYNGAASNAVSKISVDELGGDVIWFSLAMSGGFICSSENEWVLT